MNYLRCLPAQLSRYELDQLKLVKPDSRLKEAEVEAKVFMTRSLYSRRIRVSSVFGGKFANGSIFFWGHLQEPANAPFR